MGTDHPKPPDGATPALPTLEAGITLLERDEGPTLTPLHTLALDTLLVGGGTATWVDTGSHAVTRSLADLAPDPSVLDRIAVARGFTAFQHASLVGSMPEQVDSETAALVAPALDARYRGEDVRGSRGRDLFLQTLATLAGIARDQEVPVLVTREREDAFAAPLERAASDVIHYRETAVGPRFETDDFEAHVYRLGAGLVQTTLAFWREVLATRRSLASPSTDSPTARALADGSD